MKNKIINSNHYLALIVSGCIFFCSILIFTFVYYQVDLQMDNTNAAYDQMDQVQLQQSYARQVSDILSASQSQTNLLQSFFVHDDQTVGFITQVENTGAEAGEATVTIATISDDDLSNAPSGKTGFIRTHVIINGRWPSALRALHLLESLPYGESINNLRLSPGAGKEWNVGLDLTAVLIHE